MNSPLKLNDQVHLPEVLEGALLWFAKAIPAPPVMVQLRVSAILFTFHALL